MAVRYDTTGTLGKIARTPQGGIRAPAALTRSGIFEYETPDGKIRREYRDDAEVFDEEGLASLTDAPVTNLHPTNMVNAKTFASVAVGHVSGAVRKDGDKITADLVIQDDYTITLIEKGDRREISCGYTCEIDPTPGTTPGGERYDARQTKIRYNHVALVPRGRAGREVSLRLDSEGNQKNPLGVEDKSFMTIERIDGVEYTVDTDAHKAATKRRDAEQGRLDAEVKSLKAKLEAAESRLAGLDSEISEAVKTRVSLISRAHKLGVDVDVSADPGDILRAVAAKVLPSVDLEGRSSEYIEGAVAFAEAQTAESTPNAMDVRADVADTQKTTRTDSGKTLSRAETARVKMIDSLRRKGQ